MKIASRCSRLIKLVLLSLLATGMFIFAAPKEAQAQTDSFQGFEAHGGLGYIAMANSGALHGVNFTLSGGYRWGWIGAYLDQTLGGVFLTVLGTTSGAFVGSTIVGAKYFYNLTQSLELWGQSGIGVVYFDGWAGFGLKLGGGLSYKITERILVGGDFTYTLGAGDGVTHLPALSLHLRFRI